MPCQWTVEEIVAGISRIIGSGHLRRVVPDAEIALHHGDHRHHAEMILGGAILFGHETPSPSVRIQGYERGPAINAVKQGWNVKRLGSGKPLRRGEVEHCDINRAEFRIRSGAPL